MADETMTASLPVMSETLQAELHAAIARIQQVAAKRTLIDMVDSNLWASGVDGSIEAGSDQSDDYALDSCDEPQRLIA